MADPVNIFLVVEFEDLRGFKALTKLSLFDPDITAGAPNVGQATLESLFIMAASGPTSIFGRLASMSNAKIVRQGIQVDFNYAQEPTSESGTYQLVQDKATLEFGDGNGGFNRMSVPAPADALFFASGPEKLVVVDPTSSLLTNFQAAVAASFAQGALGAATVGPLNTTARGGAWGSQFFGGQYKGGKARRRRVLQGQ